MSRFSENLLAGFKVGSAIRRRKKGDEIYQFGKEKRDLEREGNKAYLSFLGGLYSTDPASAATAPAVDQSARPQTPMAAGIRDNPNNQNVATYPLKEGGAVNPVAMGTGVGQQAEAQQKAQPVFNAPDLQAARDKMKEANKLAAQYPHLAERVAAWQPAYQQAAMQKYQEGFKGDLTTLKGISDYTTYMAEGTAMLGEVISPEDAKKRYDSIKNMKSEGFLDALSKFHNGDLEGGIKAWMDSGKMKGKFTGYKPATFTLGGVTLPGYEVTFADEKGNTQTYNTAEWMYKSQAYEKQVSNALTAYKDKTDADVKSKKIVPGEDDQHLVDVITGKVTPLKTGVKKTSKSGAGGRKDDYGRSMSEIMALKKNATTIFDKSVNVSSGQFGLQGLKKEDGKLYSATTKYMYGLIERKGASDGEAADAAKDFAERAWKHRADGVKHYIEKTLREVQAMEKQEKAGGHKSLWTD